MISLLVLCRLLWFVSSFPFSRGQEGNPLFSSSMPVWPPTSVCEGLAERVHGSTRALRNNPRYWTAPRASSQLWLLGPDIGSAPASPPSLMKRLYAVPPPSPPPPTSFLRSQRRPGPRASPFPLLPSPPPVPAHAENVTLFVIKFVILGFCVVFVPLWYLFLCLKVTSCLSVSL